MRRWLAAFLFGLMACHSSSDGDDPADPAVPVVCETARSGAAVDRVTLRGVVAVPPERDAMVAPQVPGRLVTVKVHEGDRVNAGDLLAVVDDPSLAAGTAEAAAAAAAARANLDNATAALARAQRLFDQGIASRREVEDATARRAAAAADSAAATARDKLAVRQRDRARVKSPIDGVVVRLLRRPGELVDGTPATPIVEIADPVTLELRADVPAADLVRVEDGAKGQLRLGAMPDQPLGAKVVFVSPAVDPTTSLGVVRAAIEVPQGVHLKLGLTGNLVLEVGRRRDAVLVPASAIRRSSEGEQELVVCGHEDGAQVAEVRRVEVAGHTGDDAEIASGLAAGEQVVTRHVLGLEDGDPIEPIAPATAPAPASAPAPAPAPPAQGAP